MNLTARRAATAKALSALAAVLVLAACGSSSSSEAPEGSDEVKVILDFVFADGYGPLAYGMDEGIFGDHGIDLKVTPGRGGDLAMQQINTGKVDFAFADLSGYLQQRIKGETDTTAVYAWINVPQICIASLEPLESPQDMEGKTFTTVGFSSGRTTVPYVLKANGVDVSKVDIQLVDLSVLMSQLLSGKSETIESAQFGSLESNQITAEKAGKELYCTPLEDWGHRDYGKLLVVRNELIEDDPGLVERVVAAFDDSYDTAVAEASGEDIAAALKQQEPQINDEQVILSWESQREELPEVGPIEEDDVAYVLQFLEDSAGLTTDEDPASFFDNSFIPEG